jgi:hypothetical protein
MGKKECSHSRCPKCLRVKRLTKHHLHPKRYYGGSGQIVEVCRECHNDLEAFITEMEYERKKETGSMKLTKREYASLYNLWLTKY